MYNGIGISTARGSGTNGYVQSNLSHLLFSRQRVEYNADADMARNEAEITKGPNKELLLHEYKRRIEIKCAEFEDLMEEKGFDAAEIESKVDEYRKLLFSEFEAGKMNLEKELDDRNSHSRAHLAKVSRDRFRDAMGIDSEYKPGSSFTKIRKPGEEPSKPAEEIDAEAKETAEKQANIEALLATIKKEKEKKEKRKAAKKLAKEKAKEKKKQKQKKRVKKRSRKESSSSSSSSSSESESESSSSESEPETKRRKKEIKKEYVSD